MKKIGVITIMMLMSLKLFAPSLPTIDWQKIIENFKKQQQELFYKNLAMHIKSTETWHDSLNYKYGNPYKKVNRIGALGAYQFMPKTLRFLGYKGTIYQFLHSPNLQHQYMLKLIQYNERLLQKESYTYKITPMEYIGSEVKGIEITLSGMLAASHLAGVGGVQKFLANKGNPKDCNGTSVRYYLNKFKSII